MEDLQKATDTRVKIQGCRDDSAKKQDAAYAGKSIDDGMRNKDQHQGNYDMCNPII